MEKLFVKTALRDHLKFILIKFNYLHRFTYIFYEIEYQCIHCFPLYLLTFYFTMFSANVNFNYSQLFSQIFDKIKIINECIKKKLLEGK